jgi:hypothetical protein
MKKFYMNDKTINLNALLAIIFLINHTYAFGMKKKLALKESYNKKSFLAGEYNKNYTLLILLSKRVVPMIYEEKSLEDAVKTSLSLSATCKYLNTILSTNVIGKSCKHYDITEKNNVMKKLLLSMNDETYWYKRRAAFILVCAGADNTADEFYPLLRRAIHPTDKEMIAALFENNADPNQKRWCQEPDWFAIKDVDMLNMFIARDVNLHVEAFGCPNVLWWTLVHNPLPEWIELYLKYNVDAKKRDTRTGECILHKLVSLTWSPLKKSIDDYVRIGELLLNAAPELINIKNNDGDTALGGARKKLAYDRYMSENEKQTIIALIDLFEKHVGKAAQQFKEGLNLY